MHETVGRAQPIAPASRTGLRQRARWAAVRPAIYVTAVVAIMVALALSVYGGHASGFVNFGERFSHQVEVPAGTPIRSPYGYDGQYFWLLARDPLLRDHSTIDALSALGYEYRAQRVGYPLLANLAAGGNPDLIPLTLLLVNFAALVAATACVAREAARWGRSPLWAVAVGLTPGLVLSLMRDLGGVVAVTSLVAGLIAWRRERGVAAAFWFSLAVLSREPMAIGVAAVGLDAAVRSGPIRPAGRWLRKVTRKLWPGVLVPALLFIGWQLYVTVRFNGVLPASTTPDGQLTIPFAPAVQTARTAIANVTTTPGAAIWTLAYVVLTVAASIVAINRLRWSRSAASLAAAAFAVVGLMMHGHPEAWSITRYTAPLFVALALASLESRRGSTVGLWLCCGAASITVCAPLAIGI